MKWFKHSGKSLSDAKIERLIMDYGIEGYGVYFACLEMIAGNLAPDNVTFELEHDAALLAHKFKIDTILIEKIMQRCIELGLFGMSDTGKITCFKLTRWVDDYMSKSPELKKIGNSKDYKKAIKNMENERLSLRKSDKIRLNPTKSDQIKLNEIKLNEINNIYSHWNTKNIMNHKKFTDKIQRKINTILKDHSKEDIIQSIDNYTEIVHGPEYYFNYKWGLVDFIQRGFEKFIDGDIARQNYSNKKISKAEQDAKSILNKYEGQ